ncbi:MAG: glucose-1-phosphate adenylyltransferase subunit GlgD [Lachnospiraceae bacterium]|nr:glucose-1-phosphate adenylyltransferase subunit GlgD [Lachnospiraceae bacterium]
MRALGLILAGGSSNRMRELSQRRAVCAMPVAGLYRSIDFALSSMTNSHIHSVAVFTQYNARSVQEHLSSSKWWNFGRKHGGMYLFTPAITASSGIWYRGTADAIGQNLDFLRKSHEPYVIITSGDCVYKMDYHKVLDFHNEKQADITVVCKELPADAVAERFGTLRLNDDGRIQEFEEKPVVATSRTVSCGIYLLRRRLLIELIEQALSEERYDFTRDILVRYRNVKKIYGYKTDEYWSNIASVEDYYKTNMDFLKPEVRQYFFRDYPGIYTKVSDQPPAKFNVGVQVKNSIISSGCIVNGTVEDSLIFKESFIGSGCYIKNSIILNDVHIGDNCHIENCIVESHGTLKSGGVYKGEDGIKIVVETGERFEHEDQGDSFRQKTDTVL